MHARVNKPDDHPRYSPHEGGGGGRRCESEGDGVTEHCRKWGRAKANSERGVLMFDKAAHFGETCVSNHSSDYASFRATVDVL